MGDIFKFNAEKDEYDNQLTSFFYGHPLTDELFGLPLDIYLTPGLVHHWSSDVQSSSTEYVMAIKAYYTLTGRLNGALVLQKGCLTSTTLPISKVQKWKRKVTRQVTCLTIWTFHWM